MKHAYKKSIPLSILKKIGILTLLLSSATSWAAESKPGLPKAEFDAFLKYSKIEPGNLAKDQALIRKLTVPQLHTMVNSYNTSNFGFLYPVRVKGSSLPEELNKKFETLSVMSVWDNKLKPIPYQFDEFDKKSGYIYIPKINKNKVDGTYLQLDPNDELLFLYRDAGETRYNKDTMALQEGSVVQELMFTDNKGRNRYAYVVENNSERSTADYISTDLDNSKAISSFYEVEWNPKNFLDFKDARPYVGSASDQRVIDNIFFQLSANVFSRFVKVGMNSADNVRIKVLGKKDGPIRSSLFVKLVIVLAGKVPIFSMNSEIRFYEQGISMPNKTEVGKGALFVKLFKNAEILLYTDMNGLEGAKVSAQTFIDESGQQIYGTVDGEMDEQETLAANTELPGDWVWIESGKGWDIFMSFRIPMDKLTGMTSKVYYLDDKTTKSKHESFKGASPRIGLVISGLPDDIKALESIDMEYSFWFPDTVGADGPEAFFKEERNPPKLVVSKP